MENREQVLEQSLDILKMAHQEAVSDLESLNTRLGLSIGFVAALGSVIGFNVPEALESVNGPFEELSLFYHLIGISLIVIGVVLLLRGLLAKAVDTPYDFGGLSSQKGEEFATLVDFYEQQLAQFGHYTPKYLKLVGAKASFFNRGVVFAICGVGVILTNNFLTSFV